MKCNESAHLEDSVIWEKEMENSIKFEDSNSSILGDKKKSGIMKKTSNLFRKLFYKVRKNFYLIITLNLIALVYYLITFECLIYMYESHLINNPLKAKVSRVTSLLPSKFEINEGTIYFLIFNIIFILFIICFIRSSCTNPGTFDKEYSEIFSLKKYNEIYTKFYVNIIANKKQEDFNNNTQTHNNPIEFPKRFRSSTVFEKLNGNEEDSDIDSIMVDPDEKFIRSNPKLKKFEYHLNSLRTNNRYKYFWSFHCYNFRNRSLRENICRFCSVLKPERAYHCKHCRNCIRKMDHHCFFINNCIGYKNYKLFITMLFYTISICAISCLIILKSISFILEENMLNPFSVFFLIVTFAICLVGSLVLYFFIYHMSLIFKGITQLEDTFRYDQRYDDYYDYLKAMSKWKRFSLVLGTNPILWFLPVCLVKEGEGYMFIEGKL